MKFVFSLLLFALLATTGCRSPGHKLEPGLISQIKEGTTTRVEVEQTFGERKHVMTGANHKTLTLHKYRIDHHNPGWRGVAEGNAGFIELRGLTVLYDTNATVEKVLFHQSNTTVRRDRDGILIGWSPANADLDKIKTGITSLGEIIQWYGTPSLQTLTIDGDRMLCWSFLREGRFQSQKREQEFQVVVDSDDFVTNFRIIGNTDAAAD